MKKATNPKMQIINAFNMQQLLHEIMKKLSRIHKEFQILNLL